MKRDLRRYAPVGLALAGIGLAVALGVLVVKAFAAAGLYLPRDPELINTIGLAAAAVTILGLSLFAILDPDRTRGLFSGRQARHGSNALLMLLAFTGILIFINFIVYENPKSWDVTSDKQNTLAPESVDTLSALPGPVRAVAFYSSQSSPEFAQDLLEKYKSASQGRFDYEFVDPVLDPARAEAAGITQDGTIALYLGEQKELVSFATQENLTGALVRLMNPETRAVYFLTGNGERDIENAGDTSFASAKQVLESKNYTVGTLNLVGAGDVPADASAVIVAGPQVSLSQDEIASLKAYLDGGGSLIVMDEPALMTEMGDQPDLLAEMLKSDWGISLTDDLVIDPEVSNPFVAATLASTSHPITDPIQNMDVFFPTARSVAVDEAGSLATLTDLGFTGSAAWGETDYTNTDQQPSYDPDADIASPLQIGVAGENSESNARIVVFGDADFASDAFFNEYPNRQMFVNSVDWAAGNDKLISLTPFQTETRTFQPPSSLVGNGLILFSVCLLPLVVVGGGVWVWVAHRRRG